MRIRIGVRSTAAARKTAPPIAAALAAALTAALLASACSGATASGGTTSGGGGGGASGVIEAIGAENEYASVIAQVGGKYVHADAIMSNPNTDPHTFEASPAVAREISQARLIVHNGVGYDTWATTIENAAPDQSRKVINVQQLPARQHA
jgi:zinc/manganese transport system substrate-binding protein